MLIAQVEQPPPSPSQLLSKLVVLVFELLVPFPPVVHLFLLPS